MMYAELTGDSKKQRIKSLYDNKFAYVEFGHRQTPGRYVPAIGKRLTAGWVEGKFMLTISEQEVQESSRAILEAKLKKKLGECFK